MIANINIPEEYLQLVDKKFKPTGLVETVYGESHKNIIIVECGCGHRQKIDLSKDNIRQQIQRGCIYCYDFKEKVMNEAEYNQNLMLLSEFIRRIPEAKVFDNYEYYDESGRRLRTNELTICSTKPIHIVLKDNCIDELDIFRNLNIQCIMDIFEQDYFKGYLIKKSPNKIVTLPRKVKPENLDNNIYYLDNCYMPVTKEMLEIADQFGCSWCLMDKHNIQKDFPYLLSVFSEPDIVKRAEMINRESFKVPVFKRKYRGK